jgi:glycine reductase
VLEKEIERAGIPAVLITTLIPIAETLRANRIVPGIAITHPLGDPRLSRAEERSIRKQLLDASLHALTTMPKEEPIRSKDTAPEPPDM